MPGPLILRWISDRQVETLASNGVVAFYTRIRLERDLPVMVWYEEKASWIHARVREVYDKPGLSVVRGLVGLSGFKNIEDWLEYEAERHGGGLPKHIIVLEAVNRNATS